MTAAEFQALSQAFPWLFPGIAFVLGACVGSFLNVVIYRVPAGKSVVTPGSHCACGQPIHWYDNIPIFSWIILRGHARCCGRGFSIRYPAIELLTGVLFAVCWTHFPPAVAVCGFIFVSALIGATFIDLDHMIIPDVFTLGLAVVGLVLSVALPALHRQQSDLFAISSLRSGVISLQGLLIGSGLVLWIALLAEAVLRKEAMGFGDVKFVGAIGAFCGWKGAVFSIFGGALVGTIWFICAAIWQRLRPAAAAPAPGYIRSEPVHISPGSVNITAAAGNISPESAAAAAAENNIADNAVAVPGAPLGFGMHVPFGPMLAIAGALYFLFLQRPVDAWFMEFTGFF